MKITDLIAAGILAGGTTTPSPAIVQPNQTGKTSHVEKGPFPKNQSTSHDIISTKRIADDLKTQTDDVTQYIVSEISKAHASHQKPLVHLIVGEDKNSFAKALAILMRLNKSSGIEKVVFETSYDDANAIDSYVTNTTMAINSAEQNKLEIKPMMDALNKAQNLDEHIPVMEVIRQVMDTQGVETALTNFHVVPVAPSDPNNPLKNVIAFDTILQGLESGIIQSIGEEDNTKPIIVVTSKLPAFNVEETESKTHYTIPVDVSPRISEQQGIAIEQQKTGINDLTEAGSIVPPDLQAQRNIDDRIDYFTGCNPFGGPHDATKPISGINSGMNYTTLIGLVGKATGAAISLPESLKKIEDYLAPSR